MGSFLAKSTTRVMAGVMILVNSLKASKSTLSPSDVGATGDCPMSSGCRHRQIHRGLTLTFTFGFCNKQQIYSIGEYMNGCTDTPNEMHVWGLALQLCRLIALENHSVWYPQGGLEFSHVKTLDKQPSSPGIWSYILCMQ